MSASLSRWLPVLKGVAPFVLGFGIWLVPIPEGLTREAWHLFALFSAAIFAVIVNAYPLLTSALLAGSIAVLSNTLDPAKALPALPTPACCWSWWLSWWRRRWSSAAWAGASA